MTPPGYERRHGQTERNGTWETLLTSHDPTPHLGAGAKRLPIRQRKGRKLNRESDEAIVPTKGMQHNMPGGKGLC